MASSTKCKAATFDLSVFDYINTSQPQAIYECSSDDFRKCPSCVRLLTALQYYSLLKIHQDHHQQYQQLFAHFTQNVYKIDNLLNDYHVLIKNHSDHILEINSYLLKKQSFQSCEDVTKCGYALRHHRTQNINIDNDKILSEPLLNLYASTLDSLHYNIFHLYHVGLRVKKMDNKDNNDNDETETKTDNDCFDAVFSKMRDLISSTKHQTKSFNRFPNAENKENITNNNTKFNININSNTNDNDMNHEQGTTFLDKIYQKLIESKINEKIIYKLMKFISDEEYCTESIDLDLNHNKTNGNIAKYVENAHCIQNITDFMNASRRMFFHCIS